MDDIAPELLEELRRLFLEQLGEEPLTAESWPEAYAAAEKVGDALAGAFGQALRRDALPDGRMYWNIADRAVRPLLEQGYTLAADAAEAAQQALNTAAGLGLRAVAAPLDTDRVDGILNRLAAAEQYEDVSWLLDEPVRLLARSAVDETVRRNVEFQGKAGLRPRVVRTAEPGACKWCRALAGSYDYPDVPKDVYRRHENCRCRVEYDPRDGRRQDVWGKQWTEQQDSDILEERKLVGTDFAASLQPERVLTRSSGQVGATDGYTVINNVEPFDFNDKPAVERAINAFLEQHSNSPVEHAIVISPQGQLYRLTGISGSVNPALIGEDALRGSIGAHNHPVWEGFECADSFSRQDVGFSVRYHTGFEYLTSGTRRASFRYTGDLTATEIEEEYRNAVAMVQEDAFLSGESREFWQNETMLRLADILKGFEYNEQL